jgi:hypothetical protein
MPTRDDAAYKAAYETAHSSAASYNGVDEGLLHVINHWDEVGRVAGPDRFFGRLDGLIEAACERGLCADVRDWWHKKPAGDELEW